MSSIDFLKWVAEQEKTGNAALTHKAYFHREIAAQENGEDVAELRAWYRDHLLGKVKAKLDAFKSEVGKMQEVMDVWGEGAPGMDEVFLEYEMARGNQVVGVFVGKDVVDGLEMFKSGKHYQSDRGTLIFKSSGVNPEQAWWAMKDVTEALELMPEVEELIGQHLFTRDKPKHQA